MKFWANLNEAANNESFGFSNIKVIWCDELNADQECTKVNDYYEKSNIMFAADENDDGSTWNKNVNGFNNECGLWK